MIEKIYQILFHIEKKEHQKALDIANEIEEKEKFISYKLLALGETYYANPNQDNYNLDYLTALVDKKISQLNQNIPAATEQIALDYAALKLMNMILKRDDVQSLLTELRLHVFSHNIDQGTLIANSQNRQLDTSILRSCVPYSLFEPEDLIVVAAYQKMLEINLEEHSAESLVDIILYAIDKRDVYIAAKYLKILEHHDNNSSGYELCKLKIESLLDKEIIHKPFGNNHPYAPQKFERSPRKVTNMDIVTISAVANDLNNLELVINDSGVISKYQANIIEDIIEYAQFTVGPFRAGSDVSYYFTSADSKSELYTMPISIKHKNLQVESIDQNLIKIKGIAQTLSIARANHSYYKITLATSEKDPSIKITQVDNGLLVDDLFTIDLTNSAITCGEINEFELSLIKDSDLKIYGFGERYNSIVQEDVTIDNYVFSQYKDQGIKTYIPMPLAFTNKNFGILSNTHSNTKFKMSAKNLNICMEEQDGSLYILVGTYQEQIQQMQSIIGKPERLANWVYGPWMSSNNWDSQEEVLYQKNKTLDLDIPSTVLVIEQWSDEATFYAFNDATYDEKKSTYHSFEDYQFKGRWPDPKGMVEELHAADLKCFLWQIPVIKYVPNIRHLQKNLDEQYALEQGYLVKHQDGRPYRIAEDWFKDSLVIDFTNEKARNWWFDKRKYLVDDIGIDGFKTDGGECLFGHDLILDKESNSQKVRNLYPETYISSYYKFLKERGDGFTFSRAGYINAASYPAHWAGDERSTFSAFDRTIKAGINAGLSGITYWGWDLAGFNGDIPSSELFIRSTQMATFCPIMQYHAESKGEFNQDRTPWNIAERHDTPEVIDIYRSYAHLRMQLIPYIKNEAEKALDGGKPLMRALFLEHDEPQYYSVDDQYYFGDSILVAPVKEEGTLSREVVIPEDGMINAFSLKEYNKGIIEITSKLSEFPVLLRSGQLIPMNIKNELASGMRNKDYENFSDLKFIYTGGDAQMSFEGIEITIKDGEVSSNHSVVIIDLLDKLTAEGIAFDWNGNEVKEKRFEDEY